MHLLMYTLLIYTLVNDKEPNDYLFTGAFKQI